MLWYKSWLETRWRFLVGLGLLLILAAGTIFEYLTVAELLPLARTVDVGGPMGKTINEAIEVQSTYRGFVWWHWFRQNLTQLWTLFAVLLGSGSVLSRASGGALFTLSLPASRNHLLGVRAATSLAELLVLAFVPSLLIPLLSPAIDQGYSVVDVMVHGACVFIAGAVLFGVAFLLSTVFDDVWRPLLITCALAVVLALGEQVVRDVAPYGLFRVMTGETYFRSGQVPWAGLLASGAVATALLYGAVLNFARRDF
jgi:hypothetical protein